MIRPLSNYSTNREDNPVLDQMAPYLWSLTIDQQVAVAIATLYEAYEPDMVSFDYDRCPSRQYDQCIDLIQLLSTSGKLALCRAILEHLAVEELAGKGEGSTASSPGTFLALATDAEG